MSRPKHIAALDAALDESLTELEGAEQEVRDFLAKHIDLLDEYDKVLRARAEAHGNVRACYDTIKELGYYVDPKYEPSKRGYSEARDRQQARQDKILRPSS